MLMRLYNCKISTKKRENTMIILSRIIQWVTRKKGRQNNKKKQG